MRNDKNSQLPVHHLIMIQFFLKHLLSTQFPSTILDFGDIVSVLNMTDKVPAFILKSYIQLGEADNKHINSEEMIKQ